MLYSFFNFKKRKKCANLDLSMLAHFPLEAVVSKTDLKCSLTASFQNLLPIFYNNFITFDLILYNT